MYYANCQTTGGYINGETKLAITLRLMNGGSYLDIAPLYCCGYSMTYEIFHSTIEIKFEGIDYLNNVLLTLEKRPRVYQ